MCYDFKDIRTTNGLICSSDTAPQRDAHQGSGYSYVAKGMSHFAWFTEETVLQLHGMGPQGITYVNPADDPRKK